MKLKRLKLVNFQSHKNSVIELSEGLNCIIGPSHVGKSSIVRALKFLMFNDLRGEKFVTWNEKVCRVSMEFDNGLIITREREGAINRYILTKDGVDEKFENFGLDIPPKIKELLGVDTVKFDIDKSINLNIREQHSSPFLLNESDSTRAKAVGSLIGLHYVDGAIRSLMNDAREQKQIKVKSEIDLKETQIALDTFPDITVLEKKLSEVNKLYQSIGERSKTLDTLIELKNLYGEYNSKVKSWNDRYANVKKIDVSVLEKFEQKLSVLDKRKDFYRTIENFVEKKNRMLLNYDNASKEVDKNKVKFADALLELKLCPICYSSLTEEKIKEVVSREF